MIGNPATPYTTEDAKAHALRLYANPEDADLHAEVQERLRATDAQFDPNADDLIDPTAAIVATTARDCAIELMFAATNLEMRRAGITERQARAAATRARNKAAKEEAERDKRRSTHAPLDVDKVWRDK